MLKKINALVLSSLMLSACSNPSVTPTEPDHSATGGDPLPSGTVLIDPHQPAAPPPILTPTTPNTGLFHRVQRGDTLFSLAKRYNVSVKELMHWNHLSSPTALKVGQMLQIPSSTGSKPSSPKTTTTYHIVRRGDTLFSVARHYRQSVKNIAKWNGLKKSARLKVGQKLRVGF